MSAKGGEMAPMGINDLDKVKAGMKEKEVVFLFGPPPSFGIDEKGRDYIHFENWKASRTEKKFVVTFIGNISADTAIKGIIFEVYLTDGIVQGASRHFYQISSQ